MGGGQSSSSQQKHYGKQVKGKAHSQSILAHVYKLGPNELGPTLIRHMCPSYFGQAVS